MRLAEKADHGAVKGRPKAVQIDREMDGRNTAKAVAAAAGVIAAVAPVVRRVAVRVSLRFRTRLMVRRRTAQAQFGVSIAAGQRQRQQHDETAKPKRAHGRERTGEEHPPGRYHRSRGTVEAISCGECGPGM